MKERLPEMLNACDEFVAALHFLTLEQSTTMIEAMKAKLPRIIRYDGYKLEIILRGLTPDQRTVVVEVMKDDLPEIIKDIYMLKSASEYLNERQFYCLLDIMKDKLLGMVNAESKLGIKIQEVKHRLEQGGFAALSPEEVNVIKQLIVNYVQEQQNAAVKLPNSKARLSFFADDKSSHKKPRVEKTVTDEALDTKDGTSSADDSKGSQKRPRTDESDDDTPQGKRPG